MKEKHKKVMRGTGVEPLSSCTFLQVFEEQNLSLYTLKKGECDLCAAFNYGDLSQDQYDIHQQKKREAREENDSDKVSEECVYIMDLQSGLTANEFPTIITSFVRSQLPLPDHANKSILNSDGCCYQDRNTTLSNTLLPVAMTNNVVIEQEYLDKGHA
ncbi:hypothetical protein PR048_032769 [Dryococelus australis]|uniref:Uncharacterized protein n=1 Tax=Dryococelus australis TaxID=614101 RepID=A0ABQ9G642_9NEOP|nr:hypothetical protein PR048_032769 [Dryococelus australis]